MRGQDEAKLQDVVRSALGLPVGVDVTAADQHTTAAWDSLAHVSLMLAIESEFGVVIDIDSQVRLTSYAAIRQYLEGRGA